MPPLSMAAWWSGVALLASLMATCAQHALTSTTHNQAQIPPKHHRGSTIGGRGHPTVAP